MKVVRLTACGGPEVLAVQDIPALVAGDSGVVVAMKAIGTDEMLSSHRCLTFAGQCMCQRSSGMRKMKIGIIGAGEIGGSLARRLCALGHTVSIANSRGTDSLAEIAAETGAIPVTVGEAARRGDIVFVAIPICRIADLPAHLFDGVDSEVVVVDTGNYYPRERDGRIDAIEDGATESRWTASRLGRPVLKAINNLHWRSLLEGGKPSGAPGRIALPVAGDNDVQKAKLLELFDQLGFDGIDAGGLDESWRQQPGTPVYGTNLDAAGVRRALSEATPERKAEFQARPGSTIGKPA